MPKRVKKRLPTDVNQWARHMVELTTGQDETPEPTAAEISKVMTALGRRGGRIGGKRRLVTMTPEQRSAVALKAARARWNKPTKAKRAKAR